MKWEKCFLIFLLTTPLAHAGMISRPSIRPSSYDVVFHFDANRSNVDTNSNSPDNTGCSTNTTWYDLTGNYSASLNNLDTCTTNGWQGSGTDTDPYKLIKDDSNDYIRIADSDNLTFNSAGTDQAFSIEIWINIDDKGGNRTIVGKNDNSNNEYLLWLTGSEILYMDMSMGNWSTSSQRIRFATSTAIPMGQWLHLVVTYDGSESASGITIYQDGTSLTGTATTGGSYTGMTNTTASFNFGSWDNGNYALGGSYSVVKIYKKELSQQEVTRNCIALGHRFDGHTCNINSN